MPVMILGAGLSGCLAGALDRSAHIIESGPGISSQHKAVLRFREDSIGHAIGVPFRRVTVRKAIVVNSEFYQPTILHANMYSRKVTNRISDRSINNLDPVERFIAPSNLHEILGDMCRGRITFNQAVKSEEELQVMSAQYAPGAPVISTVPLPKLLEILGIETGVTFEYASIHVERYSFQDCDVHQTIYFPGDETPVYRATLTGADLIIEAISPISDADRNYISNCFFLPEKGGYLVSRGSQRYGKICPLPDEVRKELLLRITVSHKVYSLGRFACWRNILMDDVYRDFHRIKQMIGLNHYDIMKGIMK